MDFMQEGLYDIDLDLESPKVMRIMWMYHKPSCDVAFMQEIESTFRTNIAIIQRKAASVTCKRGIK